MRADFRWLRRNGRKEDYILARKIYHAGLRDTMDQALGKRLADTTDPDIFCTINVLELPYTLPSMLNDGGTYTTTHSSIADMIAAQLGLLMGLVLSV